MKNQKMGGTFISEFHEKLSCLVRLSGSSPHLDVSLWCSSASIAMLCVSCFLQGKKSAVLFLDLFLEACLKELMTSATQTICIWIVLFQNEICTVWKRGRLHRQDDWQLKLESRLWWYFIRIVSNFDWLDPLYFNTGWFFKWMYSILEWKCSYGVVFCRRCWGLLHFFKL